MNSITEEFDLTTETCCEKRPIWIFDTPNEPDPNIRCRFTVKSLWIVAIITTIILILVGSLLHELYKWTGQNKFVGYWAPTSESTWEHLKLIYFPFIIAGIIFWFIIRNNTANFLFALAMAILVGCLTILVIFYTLEGMFGKTGIVIDILIYILAVIFGVWIFYYLISHTPLPNWTLILGWIIIIALGIAFIVWSYNPPDIPLFKQPTNI